MWDDHAANMTWLDSSDPPNGKEPGDQRGPCSLISGVPANVEKNDPSSKVIFSNIRVGEIGSTTTNPQDRRVPQDRVQDRAQDRVRLDVQVDLYQHAWVCVPVIHQQCIKHVFKIVQNVVRKCCM